MNTYLQAWHDHLTSGKALDIGAGNGETSLWLANHGFSVDALEPNPQQASTLRARGASFPIQLHQVDVLEFNILSEHYDLIIASAVLHFIDAELLPLLSQRLIRGLRPGGMLFAAAFTVDDPSAPEHQMECPERVRHYFKPGELRHLFQPLDMLYYDESRRAAPESTYGYRAGATLIARRSSERSQR
jgi:cyclopropane fatty-acyl-phospholipid synthase-like methyltransferase